MVTAILAALGAFGAWFSVVFVKDFTKHKDSLEDNSWAKVSVIGFIVNFFDTLGIGSFAPATAMMRGFKQVHDRIIPGTLNVSCTIPVMLEAFIFIKVIEVEPITLIAMLAAATVGAYLGAGVVSKFNERTVQITMGIALIVTAFLMLAGKMSWMPGGGEAIALTGGKLVIGIVGNFILGALMTAGIGLYAPCMALIYFLGMSPAVAFPIMMGSCAFLMPVASVKFIKEGAYNRRASMGIALAGAVGVFIAAYLVKSLPLDVLGWLVIVVVTYTGVTMLIKAAKNAAKKEAAVTE